MGDERRVEKREKKRQTRMKGEDLV